MNEMECSAWRRREIGGVVWVILLFAGQSLSVFLQKNNLTCEGAKWLLHKTSKLHHPIVLMICVWQQGAVAAITWVCGVSLLGVVVKIFCKMGERGAV